MRPFLQSGAPRPPAGRIHAVIDTDTFNEVDDQYALALLLRSPELVELEAVYAAPFQNEKASTPGEGMRKSLEEIWRILDLAGAAERYRYRVFPGAERFLPDESTPVPSPAAADLIRRARERSPGDPLYVLGIAAATDLASALLLAPDIAEKTVFVWLGGTAPERAGEEEFNLAEDCSAARVLFRRSGALVHVPCWGLAEYFTVDRETLERRMLGRGALADDLARITIAEAESWAPGRAWEKTIWDAVAAAWLIDREGRFLSGGAEPVCLPLPDHSWAPPEKDRTLYRVRTLHREALLEELFRKLTDDTKEHREL